MGDTEITLKPRKHGTRRKLQSKLYNFLERPRSRLEILYHVLVFLIVFVCISLSVFSTIEAHEEAASDILYRLEILIVIWFSGEFSVRVWSAGCRSRFQGFFGRLRFLRCPFCIIDIVTICASVVVLCGLDGQVYATSALRGLRFFQLLRLVRLDRQGGAWKLLGSVVYAHRQELLTTLYIDFLILVFSSFVMYLVEKDENDEFASFAHALWWGVITLCTVGYGDIKPLTWQGKVIASFSAIAGIAFFALPAGILGSGFALKVQEQQRQKHMIRRRVPAATLIQCLWRCYAVSEGHKSQATWKIHALAPKSPVFKNNAFFVHRLSIRRTRHSLRSPVLEHFRNKMRADFPEPIVENNAAAYKRKNSEPTLKRGWEEDDDLSSSTPLVHTHEYKGAIRAIRKLKYLVAKRKFREALKPYDIKDVIESYSTGHSDLVGKVKCVQSRLDVILGKPGSKTKDVYESKLSLASRIVNMERQVDTIEEKLHTFLEMYLEDRKKIMLIAISTQSLLEGCIPPAEETGTSDKSEVSAPSSELSMPPSVGITLGCTDSTDQSYFTTLGGPVSRSTETRGQPIGNSVTNLNNKYFTDVDSPGDSVTNLESISDDSTQLKSDGSDVTGDIEKTQAVLKTRLSMPEELMCFVNMAQGGPSTYGETKAESSGPSPHLGCETACNPGIKYRDNQGRIKDGCSNTIPAAGTAENSPAPAGGDSKLQAFQMDFRNPEEVKREFRNPEEVQMEFYNLEDIV